MLKKTFNSFAALFHCIPRFPYIPRFLEDFEGLRKLTKKSLNESQSSPSAVLFTLMFFRVDVFRGKL